jgi:hypothetical protein
VFLLFFFRFVTDSLVREYLAGVAVVYCGEERIGAKFEIAARPRVSALKWRDSTLLCQKISKKLPTLLQLYILKMDLLAGAKKVFSHFYFSIAGSVFFTREKRSPWPRHNFTVVF